MTASRRRPDARVRAVTTHPRVEPHVASALRARLVTDPARFFAREALGRRVVAQYALREAPAVQVVLRHCTPDIEAFDELFFQRIYAAPPAVARALARRGRPLRIADVGANVGLFSAWASARWPGAAITCIEPDPFNLAILRRAIAANGGGWELIAAAAGPADGTLPFLAGRFATSRGLLPGDSAGGRAIMLPVRDVFANLAAADLVKIDIEGGEWPILADPRLRELPIAALALEFHPHLCPAPDPRDLAHDLLGRAGFAVVDVPHARGAPRDVGSLWAWR